MLKKKSFIFLAIANPQKISEDCIDFLLILYEKLKPIKKKLNFIYLMMLCVSLPDRIAAKPTEESSCQGRDRRKYAYFRRYGVIFRCSLSYGIV